MFRNRKKINVRQHPRHTKNGLTVVRRHDRNILASNQPIKDKERLYHGTCRECNESYTGSSEYFCNKCYKLYEKRIEFKNKMNELEELGKEENGDAGNNASDTPVESN